MGAKNICDKKISSSTERGSEEATQMILAGLFIFLSLIIKGRASCVTECEKYWEAFGDHCYFWAWEFGLWTSRLFAFKRQTQRCAMLAFQQSFKSSGPALCAGCDLFLGLNFCDGNT